MISHPRIGSLFAGYGGLELGVSSVLGGHPAWFSEIDPAPSRVLAHHWPDVPNLGDVTVVDWDAVEPIDVLTGGFPCQDVSHAGKRLGLKPGTRSGLWSHMAYAIDKLRPRLVVAENVRGLLSAEAGGDLEPCPWCVGDGERGALRALGAVLGDLADLGYDAQWVGVRASDAGAPHGRFRVFVFAWPATDADLPRWEGREPAGRRHLPTWGAAADTTGDGRHEGWTEPTRLQRGPHAALSGDAAPADTTSIGRERTDGRDDRLRTTRLVARYGTWGDYEPAIRRWESVTGRLAPPPTELGAKGAPRLSPAFVEWLMGLPQGHVTQVPGLTRNDQLKALGNGVVPQQAALATHIWAATMTGTYPTTTTQEGAALLPTPMTAYTSRTAEEWRAGRPAGNGATRQTVGDLRIVVEELLPGPAATGTDDGRLW